MISRHTSSVPKESVVLPRLLYGDFRWSQTCHRGSQAFHWRSQACHQGSQSCCRSTQVFSNPPIVFSITPRCSETYHNYTHPTPVLFIRDPQYLEGQPEFPGRVWYSPELDPSMFRLHILSDTLGGSQWLKYILLICPILFLMVLTAKSIKKTRAVADDVFLLGANRVLPCEQSSQADNIQKPNYMIFIHQMCHFQLLNCTYTRTTIWSR